MSVCSRAQRIDRVSNSALHRPAHLTISSPPPPPSTPSYSWRSAAGRTFFASCSCYKSSGPCSGRPVSLLVRSTAVSVPSPPALPSAPFALPFFLLSFPLSVSLSVSLSSPLSASFPSSRSRSSGPPVATRSHSRPAVPDPIGAAILLLFAVAAAALLVGQRESSALRRFVALCDVASRACSSERAVYPLPACCRRRR